YLGSGQGRPDVFQMTLVRRRHVIYVQGYDPRGWAEYFRLFRREYKKFCELYRLTGKLGERTKDTARHATAWSLSTGNDSWTVETTYEFLRWEDVIRRDFARSPWWAIWYFLRSFCRGILNGAFFRILHAHWRFGIFLLYPFFVLIALICMAAA